MENVQVAPRAINELNKQINQLKENDPKSNEIENLKVLLSVYEMFQEELNKLNK